MIRSIQLVLVYGVLREKKDKVAQGSLSLARKTLHMRPLSRAAVDKLPRHLGTYLTIVRDQFRVNLKLTQSQRALWSARKANRQAHDRETPESEPIGLKTNGIYTVQISEVPNVCSVDPRLFAQQVSGLFSEIVRTSVLFPGSAIRRRRRLDDKQWHSQEVLRFHRGDFERFPKG